MACHTVHYDTTVLGRLVPFVSVSYNGTHRVKDALGASSSGARDGEEERKDGAVSDNDAEDADEDSEGPGSYRGRAQHTDTWTTT